VSLPLRSTAQPAGIRCPIRCITSTLPTGTTVVAMSSWNESPPAAGAKQQRGLVPTARVQPPVAAAKGAVFVKDSPIMPAESAWFAQ